MPHNSRSTPAVSFMRSDRDQSNSAQTLHLWHLQPFAFRKALIRHIATSEAARFPSDPFTFRRVASHLSQNITSPEDYGISPQMALTLAGNSSTLSR